MFKKLLIVSVLAIALVMQNSSIVLGAASRGRKPPKPTPTPSPTIKPSPSPTYTPTPTPSATPTPSPTPTPTPTPSPTPTPTPTSTPTPSGPVITSVSRLDCTPGSSCYSYLTTFDVRGTSFAYDSLIYIKPSFSLSTEKLGSIVSRTGSTRIIVDYINLPHCTTFDVKVSGSTGTTTSLAAVSSICP